MQEKEMIFQKLKNGLIVSCQALKEEPLHSSYIMSRMAVAAREGGACAIRANSPEDIIEIKKTVNLPIIGLLKEVYEGSEVYITPTMIEVDALMEANPEIIAMDATDRIRPDGSTISEFFPLVKSRYPKMIFMADCSCIKDAQRAQELGFDLAGTTLAGYTKDTKGRKLPDYELMREAVNRISIPVIAEGGIWTPQELKKAFDCGVMAAVVGTAITRPREITRRFVEVLSDRNQGRSK